MSKLFENLDLTPGLKSSSNKKEKPTDDATYNEANKISDICQKISYLKNIIDEKTPYHIKSKRYLAQLIKDAEPEYACRLLFTICKTPVISVDDYINIANILMDKEAWLLAKQVLETSRMVCPDKHESQAKIESELVQVNKNISGNKLDNSNRFENIPLPDKSWLIEKLYLRGEIKHSVYYAIKLLNTDPSNTDNYFMVLTLFIQMENKLLFNALINNLKDNNILSNEHKNLLLGISHYNINYIDQSIIYLVESLKNNPNNELAKTYLALNYLIKGNIINFFKIINEIPRNKNFIYIAACFLSHAFEGKRLNLEPFPNHEIISQEISKIISELIHLKQMSLVNFLIERFNTLSYQSPLPYINLYLAEVFIRENILDTAKVLLKNINDNEVHRLNSWIYNLEGNKDLAQEELRKYVEKTLANFVDFKNNKRPIRYKLMSINIPSEIPTDQAEILNLLGSAYEEAKKLVEQMCFEYGINKMTCIEASCQDCCTKTYPVISYTEYLCMRGWFDKQEQKVQKAIYERSKQITSEYKNKYNIEPSFFKDNEPHNYPREFEFNCPFLGDGKCTVYEARPFVCRLYGYGSYDGNQLNGCNYFTGQIAAGNKLNNTKKVVNMSAFTRLLTLTDKNLIGKKIAAPIPFWFSHTHEEIVEIMSKL